MKILSVVATRPNFIKIAPFIRAVEEHRAQSDHIQHVLVHTGQHYDDNMSAAFFSEFELPEPDHYLAIGSGTHAEQDGKTMIAFEKVLLLEKPDWVVVVGDVNASMSCAVTAKKMKFRVCHIEAGIRSGDQDMPEEINRMITDRISDLLLTPDQLSVQNLLKEGRSEANISFVGNIMIDTLDFMLPKAEKLHPHEIITQKKYCGAAENRPDSPFILITLHRPSNVDDKPVLKRFMHWLKSKEEENHTFIWLMHPRTLSKLDEFGLKSELEEIKNLCCLNPLTYTETLSLNLHTDGILTDSGGLQEEACVLGTPFLVLRDSTERALTLQEFGGTGYLTGNEPDKINAAFHRMISDQRVSRRPDLWDGQTAKRCLAMILKQK